MAENLSSILTDTSFEKILQQDTRMDNFDLENLKEYLSHMKPENATVTLVSAKNKGQTDLIEPFFKIDYSVNPLTDSQMASFSNPTLHWAKSGLTIRDLNLPEKNLFMAKNFEIIHKTERLASQDPKKLLQDAKMTVWHLLDGQFLLPKVSMKILLRPTTMDIHTNPETALMAALWVDELIDFLRDFSFMAQSANLDIGITMHNQSNLIIRFEGYNDSLAAVHKKFFEELEKFTKVRNEPRFQSLLANLVKRTQNLEKDGPLSLAFDLQQECLMDNHFGHHSQIAAVQKITFPNYKTFKSAFLDYSTLEILIEGNISAPTALSLSTSTQSSISKIFKTQFLPPSSTLPPRLLS
jgi:secreted Zn-dependent insulinase-like peptidase